MYSIETNIEGEKATVFIEGEIDCLNVLDAEHALDDAASKVTELVVDCSKLEYISSAGLHVLLKLQKQFHVQNKELFIRNVHEEVYDVLKVTGFTHLFNIA